eukprot:SAG25_NODE_6042_length_594_cov_0.935354_1_plen_61_part_10
MCPELSAYEYSDALPATARNAASVNVKLQASHITHHRFSFEEVDSEGVRLHLRVRVEIMGL